MRSCYYIDVAFIFKSMFMLKAASFETLPTRPTRKSGATGRHREDRFIPVDQIPGGKTPLEELEELEEAGENVFSRRLPDEFDVAEANIASPAKAGSEITSYHLSPEEQRPSNLKQQAREAREFSKRRIKKPPKLSEAA